MTASKNERETKTDHWFEIWEKNNDKGQIRNIQIKCTIIIIVQYKITENISFVVQSHENYKIDINHTPYQYWLWNNQ